MIGHKRIPSREGGVEIVVEELSTRMVALGHEVTCYNRSGHHVNGKEYDSEKITEYKGVRLKNVWTINAKGLAAMTASFFGAFACAFGKYDVIHFHAEGPCAMLWLPKLFGKKCIATIHGLDHQRAKWGRFARSYIMLGEKCAAKYADEIIVLSKNVQEYFKQTYGRDTVFIPNGVNRPQLVEAQLILEQYGLKKDDYFLYLARIVPEKGLRYLIEAYKDVKTNKKLVIAGGSSDTEVFLRELKAMAKDDERIIFTGFVQGQMLEELYSNAYTYVLPSDLEGMPLSLLEAMSYGNCCIVSDIPECTEVVEDKAVVFEKSNIKDLKEKIILLLKEENVCRYKHSALSYICEKYNWDRIVIDTLSLYTNR
ncbi:MAG: glycosyltransferase family 4 protein [Lachnospiraceae bacterium]|nr:glycosyltransferase family 4 protein [Lachnospiraceae bacterium]